MIRYAWRFAIICVLSNQFRRSLMHAIDLNYHTKWAKQTILCLASSIGCQRDAARICCWAPVPGARRPQLFIDISCRALAANPPHVAAAVDRWDRLTDARHLHRPFSACYADSVNYCLQMRLKNENLAVNGETSNIVKRLKIRRWHRCRLMHAKKISILWDLSFWAQRVCIWFRPKPVKTYVFNDNT